MIMYKKKKLVAYKTFLTFDDNLETKKYYIKFTFKPMRIMVSPPHQNSLPEHHIN